MITMTIISDDNDAVLDYSDSIHMCNIDIL